MPILTKPLDTLNRRIRYAKAQPQGKRIVLAETDIKVFEAIHRHGHLPSPFLFAFSGTENFNSFQDRLTKLYNGASENGPYLLRPEKQFASIFADVQHLVYDLNRHSKEVIIEKWSPFLRHDNHFVHQLMGACVGASIELGCPAKGVKYIPRHDVLSKKGNPMRIPLATSSLIPDDLFGIERDGSYRFFAVEIDRNTESYHRDEIPGAKQPSTIEKKFHAYLDVMKDPPKDVLYPYKAIWGVPNLMVLIVTTDEAKKKKMQRELLKLSDRFAKRFAFKVYPDFGNLWRVPKAVLTDILEPWERADGTPVDITA